MSRATLLRLVPCTLALALATAPRPALADEEGKVGRIDRLRINTLGSTDHASFQGAVTLTLIGSKDQVEYRWGGSSCPGQKLNEFQIQLLMTAMAQRERTKVAPRYSMGEGGTRCLVGFELAAG